MPLHDDPATADCALRSCTVTTPTPKPGATVAAKRVGCRCIEDVVPETD